MEENNIKLKRIKLTKLSDEVFNGLHPNNINPGFEIEGYELIPVIINEPYWVGTNWRTSTVTKIMDNGKFKTLNSTYKLEYL